jgi:hypothetical protein
LDGVTVRRQDEFQALKQKTDSGKDCDLRQYHRGMA